MFPIFIFLYFLVATVLLAIVFLPNFREWLIHGLARWGSRIKRATYKMAAVGQQGSVDIGRNFNQGARGGAVWVRNNGVWIVTCAAVLIAAPLIALLLRDQQDLSFDHTNSREVDERVAALLQGEQLVPPPPLPPELFTTREIETLRPQIRYASRQWELLDQDFRKRLLLVYKIMLEKHGYQMVLLEGYRSPERQKQLQAEGAAVTLAGPYRSYHQYGLAADNAFLRFGKIVISEQDEWAMRGYQLYGEVAKSLGMVWGGSWRSLQDYGHVELRKPGSMTNTQTVNSPDGAHTK